MNLSNEEMIALFEAEIQADMDMLDNNEPDDVKAGYALDRIARYEDHIEAIKDGTAGAPQDHDTPALVNFNFFMHNAVKFHWIKVWGESLGTHFFNRWYGEGNAQRWSSFMRQISDGNLKILQDHLEDYDYREGGVFTEERTAEFLASASPNS